MRQNFYTDRAIERNKIPNLKESNVFCIEYWKKRQGNNGELLYKNFQSKLSKRVSPENKKCCSQRTITYWLNKGFTQEESKLKVSEMQSKNSPLSQSYWLNKGFTQEESKLKVSILQNRGRQYWVDKLGFENGNKRMDEINLLRKPYLIQNTGGYSKISQELFHFLDNDEHTYFATYNLNNIKNKSKNEYTLRLDDGSWLFLDYTNTKKMKVIEFDGCYWHKEQEQEKEIIRDQKIMSKGFSILHISDQEYLNNKKEVILKCQQFLNS